MQTTPIAIAASISAAVLVICLTWSYLGVPVAIPDAPPGKVHSMSYTPFSGSDTPADPNLVASHIRIDTDMRLLSRVTKAVRLYSTDQGMDAVPAIAQKYGIKVLLGIWIGRSEKLNEVQIAQGIALAKAYPKTVKAIIVGNEVLLRGEQSPEALAAYISRVKAATGLPVTYADVTDFWMKAPPELAQTVDFITIHILPYWENKPTSAAHGVDYLKSVRKEMAKQFPGKRIFIGETGFPSAGRERKDAIPSIVNQALYLREFMSYAESVDLDYNLIEAFDQPWKRMSEGTVGGYWGMFTTDRQQKFPWRGPVSEHPLWPLDAGISVTLAALLIAFAYARGMRQHLLNTVFFGVCAGAASTLLVLQAQHSWVAWRNTLEGAIELLLLLQSVLVLFLVSSEIGKGSQSTVPAPFYQSIEWLRTPKTFPNRTLSLGLLQFFVVFGASVLTLCQCFDPRYRDFPLAAYGIASSGLALLTLMHRPLQCDPNNRLEEIGATTLLIAGAVVIAVQNGPLNIEALGWCGVNLLIAFPWMPLWQKAVRGLFSARAKAAKA